MSPHSALCWAVPWREWGCEQAGESYTCKRQLAMVIWLMGCSSYGNVYEMPKTRVVPLENQLGHDDVIKWKHFPRYWPFVWGIHRWPVNSPHKGQWRGALMFVWSAPWINGWVNNRQAGDLWRDRAHYDVIVMVLNQRMALELNWQLKLWDAYEIFRKENLFAQR